MTKPQFEEWAMPTMDHCISLFRCRGDSYGDSMRNLDPHLLNAVLGMTTGCQLSDRGIACVVLAALATVKLSRFTGGWQKDHVDDLINYLAALGGAVKDWEQGGKEPEPEQFDPHIGDCADCDSERWVRCDQCPEWQFGEHRRLRTLGGLEHGWAVKRSDGTIYSTVQEGAISPEGWLCLCPGRAD